MPLRREDALRGVEVKEALVEPVALAEREQVEPVVVRGDEDDPGREGPTVHRRVEGLRAQRERQRVRCYGELPPAAGVLTAVDELRIDTDRDVVQKNAVAGSAGVDRPLGAVERGEGAERIAPFDAGVPREVVPGAVGHADEGNAALQGDPGDRPERSVAAGGSDRAFSVEACSLARILAEGQDVDRDTAALGSEPKPVHGRLLTPGARIDHQEPWHRGTL